MKAHYAKHNDPSKPSNLTNFCLRNLNSRRGKNLSCPTDQDTFFGQKNWNFLPKSPVNKIRSYFLDQKIFLLPRNSNQNFFKWRVGKKGPLALYSNDTGFIERGYRHSNIFFYGNIFVK